MNDKYITLRSTDSVEYYPANKAWSFKVHLNEPLHLEQKWRVALTEITFENWQSAKKSDCHDIYIYTDMCEARHLVGETKEPLLRRLCLRGNKKKKTFEFTNQYYFPIRIQDTDTVHVYIKDMRGNDPSFITGPVIVTLHLKLLPFWTQ